MWYAIVTSMALLVAAQAQAGKGAAAGGPLAPTRVRLDFRNETLAEIVDGINAQGPMMLAIRPALRGFRRESGPEPPPRRYSLREPEPVTFWEAVDRIGRATETWPESGNTTGRELGVLLVPASGDRGFACNDGAFRVALTHVYYSSNLQFAPFFYNQAGLAQPKTDGSSRRPQLSAGLTVMAEPRLQIIRPVELVVREAIDDRGRSLIPAVPWRQSLSKPAGRSYPNQESVGVPLKPADEPGGRIKHLAGRVTLEAAESRAGSPGAMVEVAFDFTDVPLP